MAEKKFGLKDIVKEIDENFVPLELVSIYITWKNGKIKTDELKKELKSFIDAITPNILGKMVDYCIGLGLIKKDKNGYYLLPKID